TLPNRVGVILGIALRGEGLPVAPTSAGLRHRTQDDIPAAAPVLGDGDARRPRGSLPMNHHFTVHHVLPSSTPSRRDTARAPLSRACGNRSLPRSPGPLLASKARAGDPSSSA